MCIRDRPDKGAAPINADAVKTSAGAIFNIPICKERFLDRAVSFLKESGLKSVAATEKTNTDLYQADFKEPTVLIMGAEDTGVSDAVLKVCDARAAIPLAGEIGSLNVSVAAGICLYEAVRQRSLA
mgnify:CR=1 FL=1